MKKRLMVGTILWCLVMLSAGCATDDDSNEPAIEAYKYTENIDGQDVPSLKQMYQGYFYIGAAVTTRSLVSPHRELLLNHFNSITAEYQMKLDSLQPFSLNPADDVYAFERADQIVEFALQNDMRVRGHTLIWAKSTPGWFFYGQDEKLLDREVLLRRAEHYVKEVVGHYKGKVCCWDVVNEAISDRDGFYKKNLWLETIGEDYIEKAFRWAHAADPDARLFYNDYFAVYPAKRDKIYRMVKKLLEEGVPIHGIGIQGHWDLNWPSINHIRTAIEKFASLDLEIQITEMDISIHKDHPFFNDVSPYKNLTKKSENRQAMRYKHLFELFRDYRDVITSVTFWGVADDSTWLDYHPVKGRKNWPLVFNVRHSPKMAFWEIVRF